MIAIIAVAAFFFVALLIVFFGFRHQMRIDRRHGRYYKWWQYIEVWDFDLRRTDKNTTRWLLASAIAFTALWAWLLWREFHP